VRLSCQLHGFVQNAELQIVSTEPLDVNSVKMKNQDLTHGLAQDAELQIVTTELLDAKSAKMRNQDNH